MIYSSFSLRFIHYTFGVKGFYICYKYNFFYERNIPLKKKMAHFTTPKVKKVFTVFFYSIQPISMSGGSIFSLA